MSCNNTLPEVSFLSIEEAFEYYYAVYQEDVRESYVLSPSVTKDEEGKYVGTLVLFREDGSTFEDGSTLVDLPFFESDSDLGNGELKGSVEFNTVNGVKTTECKFYTKNGCKYMVLFGRVLTEVVVTPSEENTNE